MSLDQKFLEKKIIAYFHDPPWKAWVITGGRALLAERGGHEGDAIELLRRLGVEVSSVLADVQVADKLSSTIDRWVISGLYSGQAGAPQQVAKAALKLNLFSPEYEFEFEIQGDVSEKVSKYVGELSKLVNQENKYKYHLIYFLAPLLWYENFPNTPPLADTRVPTHTIFDHATATAAMTNIVSCEDGKVKFKGSLVVVEIPSVQEFISYSRKSRDLWASSWLTSVLLWNSIKGFVERYGPDVVLRPELSLNHFFIAWLYNVVSSKEVKEKVREYAEKYAGLKDCPRIAMMSERVVLLLPEEDGDKIVKEVLDNFDRAWKTIAEVALSGIELSNQLEKEYLEEAKEKPPIRPIVNVLRVSEAYDEFSKKVGANLSCRGSPPTSFSLFFEYLLNKAFQYTKVKYSYGSWAIKSIERLTQNANYKLCTVCGMLPAVLYDNGDRLDVKDENAEDRLCPYCAVKRSLKGKVVSDALQGLGLLIGGCSWRFPSTSELAMLNFAYHMKDKVKDLAPTSPGEEVGIEEDWIIKIFENPMSSEYYCRCYSGNKEACGKLAILDEETLKKYGSLYYAVIKADGDNLGKVWKGVLLSKEGEPMTLKKYLETVLERLKNKIGYNVQLDVDAVVREVREARRKLYGDAGFLDGVPITMSYAYALSRALTVQAVIDKVLLEESKAYPIYLGGDDILALSPVRYKDRLVVLDSVKSTREAYWVYSDDPNRRFDGFKSLKGLVVDSLRTYGRSYAVFVAHYRDPMTMSISLANYYLELKDEVERADDVKVGNADEMKIKRKDVLFVSSGRGMARLESSALKMSEGSEIRLQLVDLIDFIDGKIRENALSKSFVYDSLSLDSYKDVVCREPETYKEVYKSLVERVVSRNAKDEEVSKAVIEKLSHTEGLWECIKVKGEAKEAYLNVVTSLRYLL